VLQQKAAAIDRSVRKLDARQFHGTYRLTASRALASGGAAKRKAAATRKRGASTRPQRIKTPSGVAAGPADNNANRAAVRETLLQLASEVARAENKADLIGVLGSLDRWVDRVMGRGGA